MICTYVGLCSTLCVQNTCLISREGERTIALGSTSWSEFLLVDTSGAEATFFYKKSEREIKERKESERKKEWREENRKGIGRGRKTFSSAFLEKRDLLFFT